MHRCASQCWRLPRPHGGRWLPRQHFLSAVHPRQSWLWRPAARPRWACRRRPSLPRSRSGGRSSGARGAPGSCAASSAAAARPPLCSCSVGRSAGVRGPRGPAHGRPQRCCATRQLGGLRALAQSGCVLTAARVVQPWHTSTERCWGWFCGTTPDCVSLPGSCQVHHSQATR
jgi:hypothetical protein